MSLLTLLETAPESTERPLVLWIRKHAAVRVLLVSLFALYGFFLTHKIDLTTADLGRHIKNGEVMFQDANVLSTNYYSYTNPDFPVLNHHSASGALFYFAHKFGGFPLVQLLFIALSLAAFVVFLLTARQRARWGIIGFVALLAIPLLGERTEIRPEVWSYLFAGLFFLILTYATTNSGERVLKNFPPHFIRMKWPRPHPSFSKRLASVRFVDALWLLPLIEIFWVNTHIYFLLGPLLVGAFLVEAAVKNRVVFLRLLAVSGVTFATMLVNPFGYRAVTKAASIFGNYGYRLAENQSVWFLEGLGMHNPNFLIFKIALASLALSYLVVLVRNRAEFRLAHFFVIAGIGTLAVLAERNLALFGLFFIPTLSENIAAVFTKGVGQVRCERAAAFCGALIFVLFVIFGIPRSFPYWHSFGLGLEAGNNAAADFLREHNIKGPYFNDYDIGGYLIFHLFPREKVFVDNRPEAYPAAFFQNEYIPMQENEEKWKEGLARHDFNAIVFSRNDMTPWAQKFLAARAQDPAWALVFADNHIVIFTRQL